MAEKENRTGDIALGLLGATAADAAGSRGAAAFAGRSHRAGKPKFPQRMFKGLPDGLAPFLEPHLKARSSDPLLLDRKKLKAERARLGVGVPAFAGKAGETFTSFTPKGDPDWFKIDAPDTTMAFHEMGHATQPKLMTTLHHHLGPGLDRGEGMNVGDGLRAGFLIGALADPSGGVGKTVHDNAALLTGLTEIPTLMSELRASYSALKGLHAVGGKAAVKGGLRQLAPALATYLASAAGHVGAVALARHMAGGHEKTAAAKDTLLRVGKGLAGAGAASLGGGLAMNMLANAHQDSLHGKKYPASSHGKAPRFPAKGSGPLELDARKWRAGSRSMGLKKDVPILAGEETQVGHYAKGGKVDYGQPVVMLRGPDLPSAFHELGHARQHDALSTAHRAIHVRQEGQKFPAISYINGAMILAALAHPKSGPGKFIHDHAALIQGLAEVPALAEEARATYHAMKATRDVEGPEATRGALKTLAPAFGTYLAGAIGGVGSVAAARRLSRPKLAAAGAPGAAPAAAPAGGAPAAGAAPAGGGGAAKMPTLGVPKAVPQPKVTGALRLSSIAANATPIGQLKPKTTPPHPGNRRGNFPGIATAKPPSLTGYYRDTLDSMDAPSRGTRT